MKNENKPDRSLRRGYLELLRNVMILLMILLVAFTQIFLIAMVHGTDMYPKLLDGDVVMGYRLDHNYVKNDVVICKINGEQMISRVIARAGDQVDIVDGRLFVNGTEQTEEIVFDTGPGTLEYPYLVPEDSIFLLGDHRTDTADSRTFGAVPISAIKAKVFTVLRRRGI